MVGGRSPYLKGYRFETRVRKYLESKGYYVERRHKSAFPDLICLQDTTRPTVSLDVQDELGGPCFVECKCGGRLSPDERERFKAYEKHGNTFIAYPAKTIDGGNMIIFAKAETREVVHKARG